MRHVTAARRTVWPHDITSPELWRGAAVGLLSALYYLMYHGLPNLHDAVHYLVSGVSMIRDRHALISPYTSMDPALGWGAYEYFQDNSRLVSLYRPYPSQLYSALLGVCSALSGSVGFGVVNLVSLLAFAASNVLLYFVGLRFFGRALACLFVLAVAAMPVMGSALYPSNDAFALLAAVFVIWACLCVRPRPFFIGVVVGLSAHLRAQALQLSLVAPILMLARRTPENPWRSAIEHILGVAVAYTVVGRFLGIWGTAGASRGDGGIGFYIDYFSTVLAGPAPVSNFLSRLLDNASHLPSLSLLFFSVLTGLAALLFRAPREAKALALAGFSLVLVPLLLYSVDPYSNPLPRYYVMAVPMFTLAWFRWMVPSGSSIATAGGLGAVVFTTVLAMAAWFQIHGPPWRNVSSLSVVHDRWVYPRVGDFQKPLARTFSPGDLIITNHALASVLAPARHFIPYPSLEAFESGDNREIDGIVFIYGDQPPDDFFKPRGWMQRGDWAPNIVDHSGTRFSLVAQQSLQAQGSSTQVHFIVYKNMGPKHHVYSGDERVYHVRVTGSEFVRRTADPEFESAGAWAGVMQRAPSGHAVQVGPGSDNANVLTQRFRVLPGEQIVMEVRAFACGKALAQGRLQINWLDGEHRFLKTDIAAIPFGSEAEAYRRTLVAPPGAVMGLLVVSPHRQKDVVCFTRAEVLGRASP